MQMSTTTLSSTSSSSVPAFMRNRVVISVMIKNERDVIVPTLQPFLSYGYSNIVILDTGSTLSL